MKLCLLGDNGSVHVQKWIQALSQFSDIEINVLSLRKGIQFNNVRYHNLKEYTGNKIDYILNIPYVKKIVREIKPDIVHSHYATSYGLLGATLNFKPYILTGWGADIFDSPKNPVLNKIVKYSLSKADSITVLSEITKKEISKLTDKEITTIPFGVDLKKFKKGEKKDEEKLIIGTIRTLSSKYGVEYLIRAFSLLCSKHNNIKLEIVGDGNLRSYLEDLVNELNISQNVQFYGYINQIYESEKYEKILSNFNIFVIPSIIDSETFGVAAVEASACSIPVIATNVGGLPEVIIDNETGLLIPPKDYKKLADAIEKLIVDKNLRISFGIKGRNNVETNYNWEKNVLKMINLYKIYFPNINENNKL